MNIIQTGVLSDFLMDDFSSLRLVPALFYNYLLSSQTLSFLCRTDQSAIIRGTLQAYNEEIKLSQVIVQSLSTFFFFNFNTEKPRGRGEERLNIWHKTPSQSKVQVSKARRGLAFSLKRIIWFFHKGQLFNVYLKIRCWGNQHFQKKNANTQNMPRKKWK